MQGLPWITLNPAVSGLTARQSNDGSICLPSDLLAAVPDCAANCLLDFALTNYQDNTCPFTSSLTYLCTSTTSSGLTIGEGSIQCIVSRCTGDELTILNSYNTCDSVPGAIPKAASVITATIQPASTASPTAMDTPLPPIIGNPTTTQDVTSIVMASGIPSLAPPPAASSNPSEPTSSSFSSTDTLQPSSTTGSGGSSSTNTSTAVADRAAPSAGLSSGSIAGIGIGASLLTFGILALIYWRCQRREKLKRRRSTRWSMHGARTPPPNYDLPPDVPPTTTVPETEFLAAPTSTQRFYSAAPAEEKRRSFWRRSIKPEDIGVAVSPHVNEASSPTSFSSQRSMMNLLPKVPEKLPTRSIQGLWPAPLKLESARNRQSRPFRPLSDVTVFDEDIEATAASHPPRLTRARDSVVLRSSSAGPRERTLPAPLQLNPIYPNAQSRLSEQKELSPTARIPLTPTYDNGNFIHSPPRAYPPSSWRQFDDMLSPPPLSALPEELSPTRNAQPHKNVLRKKIFPPSAVRAVRSAAPKPQPPRKDSDTTVATEIEEDTSPDEVDKQLEMLEKPTFAPISICPEGPRSPISNLQYPAIPPSAEISRQAGFIQQRSRNLMVPTTSAKAGPVRPSRDQLVRNEASFVVSDTTSSDGYLSDRSIEWPVPPMSKEVQKLLTTVVPRLRENPSSANRESGQTMVQRSMDSVLGFNERSSSLNPASVSVAKQRPAPAATQNRDLFFKVEL